MMCFASAVVSAPGAVPDLAGSEDVLTWMWMLRGGGGAEEGGRRERPVFSAVAFLVESTEETR